MLSRATTNAVAHRASSMRRMRRRVVNATRPYCATNGCTSFLVIDDSVSRPLRDLRLQPQAQLGPPAHRS